MSKNWVETEGLYMTSQYAAYTLHAGLARLHALMRMHTHTRLHTHMHARTHTPISNIRIVFHGNNDSRTRLNITSSCKVPVIFVGFQ